MIDKKKKIKPIVPTLSNSSKSVIGKRTTVLGSNLSYLNYNNDKPTNKAKSRVSESKVVYSNPKKLAADEVEQLIIAKCLRDAKAIERGELKTKSFANYKDLIADLEADIQNDDEI
jgi:hypothetical protein